MAEFNPFIRFCQQFSGLSEAAETSLLPSLVSKRYRRRERIVSQKEICSRLYFVESGLVKLCYPKTRSAAILMFFPENSPFTVLDSFLSQTPGDKYVEAVETTRLWSISKASLETLCQRHHCIESFYRKLLALACVRLMKRFQDMMNVSAEQRYDIFLAENGPYVNRIHLRDIAAYLGINQVSLSRIRGRR